MYDYMGFNFMELNLTPDEVIAYLRKSRTDDPLLSVEEVLARHEQIIDEWAERHLGGKIPEENKFREIVSGETIAARPEMQKVLRLIESPNRKAIIGVDVERLSRGDLEDCGRLMKLLRYTNTIVITPQEIFDLHTEYGRDRFERKLKQGNDYLEYSKKIMQRGTLLSVSAGNYLGSIAPYGYDKATVMEGKRECPTLSINPEKAEVVRMIYEMYVNQDVGVYNIAHRLDEAKITPPKGKHWSPEGVRTILSNIHYTGKTKRNWRKVVTVVEDGEIVKTRPRAKIGEYMIYEGKHEAIISEELFNAAQEKTGKNSRTKAKTKVRNPLASLLFCQCGRAMTYRTYTSHDAEPRLLCIGQTHCHTGSCTFEEMIAIVADILRNCIADFEIQIKNNNGEAVKVHETLVKNLERKMEELEAREIAQWEAQSHPDPAQRMPPKIFAMLNEKLLQEKGEVREALCEARRSAPAPVDYEEKLQRFRDALDALLDPDKDPETKNRLLKACIERIEYSRQAPERTKSQSVMYYDKERKHTRTKSPLPTGGNWTQYPIEIDVKLKV